MYGFRAMDCRQQVRRVGAATLFVIIFNILEPSKTLLWWRGWQKESVLV
jgi:hypothetical protein